MGDIEGRCIMADESRPPRPDEGFHCALEPSGFIRTTADDWVWDDEAGAWRPSDDPNWVWDEDQGTWGYNNTNPDSMPAGDGWVWDDVWVYVAPPDPEFAEQWVWDMRKTVLLAGGLWRLSFSVSSLLSS